MSEDPMEPRRCTARSKQSGERCKRTPIVGGTVCATHGGKAPQVRAAAAEKVQQEKAAAALSQILWATDAVPVTDSVSAMQLLAGKMHVAVDVLGARLNERVVCPTCHRGPEPLDGTTGRAWLTSVRELRQLLADMERLGIAERAVQIEADRVRLIAVSLGRVFDAMEFTPEDRERGIGLLMADLRGDVVADGAAGSGALA